MGASSSPMGCADIRVVADGEKDPAHLLDQTRLGNGSLGGVGTGAVWVSGADGRLDRATVMLFGDGGAHGERSSGGHSLLFASLLDGIDLSVAPAVVQTVVATPCCRSGLGVTYRDLQGRRGLVYAHIHRPRRVNLPVLAPGYRSQLAVGDGVRMGGVTFEALSAAGVLCLPAQGGQYVLWSDAEGRPRGWERCTAATLSVPRHVVAGTQILAVGLGPAGPQATKGFERLPAAASLGQMAAVEVFDQRVRDF
ncbi:MAG: hypothetical protein ACYDGR_11225 [Candidatus Dormibacteria bacterium]